MKETPSAVWHQHRTWLAEPPHHTPVAGPTQSFIDTATRLTLHISDSEDAAWRSGLQYGQPTLEADLSATWDCKHWSAIDRTVNQISDLSDEDFAKENWAAKMFCNTQAAVTRVICPTFSEKLCRLQGLWPLHSGGAKKYHSRYAAFKITILGACTSPPTILALGYAGTSHHPSLPLLFESYPTLSLYQVIFKYSGTSCSYKYHEPTVLIEKSPQAILFKWLSWDQTWVQLAKFVLEDCHYCVQTFSLRFKQNQLYIL